VRSASTARLADRERWTRLVDALTALPYRERQAIEVVERHLASAPPAAEPEAPSGPPPRQIHAVK
jgi:hypothetical protein